MASISRSPAGRWIVRWQEGSTRRSKRFDRKTDALRFSRELDAQVRSERSAAERSS